MIRLPLPKIYNRNETTICHTYRTSVVACDIRAKESSADRYNKVRIPTSNVYNFFDDLEIGDKSYFFYLNGRQTHWMDYQGDEWNVVGNYELTFKLPPVPKDGTYELRIGVQANDQRGMCQVYWGTNKNALPAAGIPFDMRMGGEQWFTKAGTLQSTVGWAKDEEDEEDDDFDWEDDEDEEYDEEGFDFGDEDTTIYEVECACGNIINFDEETLEAGSIICDNCGETLEFTFDDVEEEE